MNAEIFAEWLRRQGRRVLRTPGSYWYEAGPRVYQAFPYHWQIEPASRELRALTLRHGIAAVRYSAPLAACEGRVSYHVVLHKPYRLDMLRSQARNGVRRGSSRFKVERITFERLAHAGWSLQADTLERQGRSRSMGQEEWQRTCQAAGGLPGFEAWGATCEGELAAALLVARIDDIFCIPYALCHSRFLRDHVNNALFFVASCDLLERDGVSGIFFTLQSLDAPESVDEFKFRMGFTAVPVRQHVVFHPLLRPLARARTHALLLRLLARDSGNPLVAKAEGMLRFHLAGRRPIETQDWPDCLASYRSQIADSPATMIGAPGPYEEPVAVLASTAGGVPHGTT